MKIIVVVVLAFVCGFGFAEESIFQNWLDIGFTFQMGWIPKGHLDLYRVPETKVITAAAFDSTFKIDATMWKMFIIGGSMTCNFNQIINDYSFNPSGMYFNFHSGFQFLDTFSIMYEHACAHPIVVYYPMAQGQFYFDSFYDRVYFEIKGTISF